MSEHTAINVRTLADFKRFLALPGATVQVIRNDWNDPAKVLHPLTPKPGYFAPKQVQRLQSNGVYFTTGWLAYPKAAHMRCLGDRVELCMNDDGSFRHVLTYQLTIAEPVCVG